MNDLATVRTANGVPAIPPHLPLPPMPATVASYLRGAEAHVAERARFAAATPEQREGQHLMPPRLPVLTTNEAAEARRLAAGMAGAMAPVSLATLRAWLAPVNAASRNPQGREDFEVRVAGIHAVCDDLPAGAFTTDARRLLPAFFPAGADVREAVAPGAGRLRAAHAALLRVAEPPRPAVAEPERGPRSPEEIAYVQARAAEARAVLRAAEKPDDPQPVRPAYLSGEALARTRDNSLVRAARAMQQRERERADA